MNLVATVAALALVLATIYEFLGVLHDEALLTRSDTAQLCADCALAHAEMLVVRSRGQGRVLLHRLTLTAAWPYVRLRQLAQVVRLIAPDHDEPCVLNPAPAPATNRD